MPSDDWPALRARRRRWAEQLRRVFEIEISLCPSARPARARGWAVTEWAARVPPERLAGLTARGGARAARAAGQQAFALMRDEEGDVAPGRTSITS